jgi:vancomycin resistance protein VanJ
MDDKRLVLRRLPLYAYIVLSDAYGVTTCILIGLWLLTGERISFIRVFINLLPPLLLPGIIALPIGILLRKWRPVLLVLPSVLMFLALYGTAFIPKSPSAEEANLTVLSYNILAVNADFSGVETLIRESNADVVAMQEMRSGMFNFLQENLADTHPYVVGHETETSTVIFSRFPIRESSITFPTYAILDMNGRDIIVYAIHLPVPTGGYFSSERRSERLDIVLEEVADDAMPQILLGDFNMSDATQDYRRMAQRFTDVYRQTQMGFGTTFPNWVGINRDIHGWTSLIRLDYVFVSSDIIPIDARVIYSGMSDHFGIVARLRVE